MVDVADGSDVDVGFGPLEFAASGSDGEGTAAVGGGDGGGIGVVEEEVSGGFVEEGGRKK